MSARKQEEGQMLKLLSRFRSEEGQSLVEYALIIALVAVVVIAALGLLGQGILAQLNAIIAAL